MAIVSYQLYSDYCIRYFKCLNVITLLLSAPILVMGIWLTQQTSTACETFLNLPLIITGSIVIVLFLFSILCTSCLSGWRMICVQCNLVFSLVFLLLGFTIFALVVAGGKGGGESLVGKYYKEYNLDGYSPWLQKRVNDTKHWRDLKGCLVKKNVCSRFYDKYGQDTQEQFFSRHLTSIESGCCKPSDNCNFTYRNPTNWEKPDKSTGISNYSNADCYAWDNNNYLRCFNCQSCKAGLADDIKRKWNVAAIVSVVSLCLLIVFSLMSCCIAFYSELRPVAGQTVVYVTDDDE